MSTLQRKSRLLQWGMILPALLAIVALIAFPIGYTINLSLTDTSGPASAGPAPFAGLENYADALRDTARFWPALGRTIVFTVVALSIELILGIAIALLLRKDFRGSMVARTIMLVPLVTSPVAVGAIWMLILDPNTGFANTMISAMGLDRIGFLTNPDYALWTIIGLDAWQWTPLVILIVLAGLAGVPDEPEEAALVDGASTSQRIRFVTLPMIRNTIVVAAVLRGIDALKTFDIIYATKGPGGGSSNEAETLNVLVYGLSFDYMEFGLASAILVLFFVLVLVAAVFVVRQSTRDV
ncbi:carbohydrate ABC transporter permease [Brachybacterium massiliense]|uniref:carbohydrate ABC transporter permease n=1 Tax=Brachybacterium massiliense TaxID=1755098 RepID=UPI000B3BBF87|nr:sugar ABC transporter permease [Brachybacterium massiliense]